MTMLAWLSYHPRKKAKTHPYALHQRGRTILGYYVAVQLLIADVPPHKFLLAPVCPRIGPPGSSFDLFSIEMVFQSASAKHALIELGPVPHELPKGCVADNESNLCYNLLRETAQRLVLRVLYCQPEHCDCGFCSHMCLDASCHLANAYSSGLLVNPEPSQHFLFLVKRSVVGYILCTQSSPLHDLQLEATNMRELRDETYPCEDEIFVREGGGRCCC